MHTFTYKHFIVFSLLQIVFLTDLQAEPSRFGVHVDIAPEISHISYDEPGVMKESGSMYGFSVSSIYRAEKGLGPVDMFRADFTGTWGRVDYSSTQSGNMNGIKDSMFEARALAGADIASGGTFLLTAFIGFGYRQLNDYAGGMVSEEGYGGYDRQSNYRYTPIGIEVASGINNNWTLGAVAEYDYFWSGTQRSAITQANNESYTYSGNLKNSQHDGYGLRASVKAVRRLDSFSLAFEPFVRYWKLDNSKLDIVLINGVPAKFIEPGNSSTQYGLKVSLLY